MEAVEGNPMIEDHHGRYWWVCPCGDEGGPYDLWEQAWDAVVRHERRGCPILGLPNARPVNGG